MAVRPPVDWPTCGEQEGCDGVRLDSGTGCLAHAKDDERDATLRRLSEAGRLDVRGVPISRNLAQQIVDAARSHENGSWFVDVDFRRATFEGDTMFEGATFEGDAKFEGATFKGRAVLEGATFQGAAEFEGATFQGAAKFEGAAVGGRSMFRGAARFFRATFEAEAEFQGTTFQGAAEFSTFAVMPRGLPRPGG